jgi:hypothetical protein
MQASTAFLAAGLALEGSQEFLRVLMSPYAALCLELEITNCLVCWLRLHDFGEPRPSIEDFRGRKIRKGRKKNLDLRQNKVIK